MNKTEIKEAILKLEKKLSKIPRGEKSSPEARSLRKELRELGHFVSKNDLREGKPKSSKLSKAAPEKKKNKKDVKKGKSVKKSKKQKPIDEDEEEDDD